MNSIKLQMKKNMGTSGDTGAFASSEGMTYEIGLAREIAAGVLFMEKACTIIYIPGNSGTYESCSEVWSVKRVKPHDVHSLSLLSTFSPHAGQTSWLLFSLS